MMWNGLNLVLGLILLIFCLPTGESKECDKTKIIVDRLGNELVFSFTFSDLRDKHNKYITEHYGEGVVQNEIQSQKELDIRFKTEINSMVEKTIYKEGNPTEWAGNRTEIFMTDDAIVVKITKLQKEDAGIYSIYFRSIRLGQKALIITDKPKITGRSPPNPIAKPEDKYTSNIQLECHSVSTSIGECPLSMYTVWYKNGMRMTDVDSTLSQINVTVDHNGGNFTCLTTDYLPCYQRLQTTKHPLDVLTIEECNNVLESKIYKVQPEFAPIDVKLEPDEREITVNKNEDLKASCSAKCHPQCEMKWEKDYTGLNSSGFITENIIRRNLEIENIQNSHEGDYVCLVENTHGEVKTSFTLSVGETEKNEQNDNVNVYVIVIAVLVVIAVIAIIILVTVVIKRRKKEKKKIKESSEKGELTMDEGEKKRLESFEMTKLI